MGQYSELCSECPQTLFSPPSEGFFDKGLPYAAVDTGDQDCLLCNVHNVLLIVIYRRLSPFTNSDWLAVTFSLVRLVDVFANPLLVGQWNGGGEHTIRIKTALQRCQPSPVSAVSIPCLFAIMWSQLIGVTAG